MIQTLLAYVQLVHTGLILWLTVELYQYPDNELNTMLAAIQVGLTVIDVVIIRKTFNLLPILMSLSLFSSMVPQHDIQWVSVLFLGKILYINDVLADTRKLIFSGDNCSFCQLGGIIYNFIRFTLIEYMFLGVVIAFYKLIVLAYDKSGQDLPENYVLLYQMIVTATTIGYGDVCPKSRIQMNFFIGAIPFICGSFVVYGNNVNPLWEQFLAYWNSPNLEVSDNLVEGTIMNQTEKDHLNEFAKLSAERRKQQQNLRQTYFNDWISAAAINYQKQVDLVHTVVDQSFSKETKLTIASKVRQQYFPANWTILDGSDVNQDLFMITEGEIDFNGQVKSAGFVFNHKGFFCKAASGDIAVTKSFVTVWALNLRDLEELGKNSPKTLDKINRNIAAYS